MADSQSQANIPQDTTAPQRGKHRKQKQRRQPSRMTVWWRFFWNQRSSERMVWALILAMPAPLAAIYLALPQGDQAQVVEAIQAAGQTLGAAGLRVGVEVTLLGFGLASLALFLAPSYRKYRYLHVPTSVIPPITVYVDAENLNGKQIMDALTTHLRLEFLQGSRAKMRADLLFFMDAADTRSRYTQQWGEHVAIPKWHYEALYKSGFRLINSPHVFTGKAGMAEAVDREIAMHALERAIVGGIKQEFVIVSGDGDYAPLIYRLIALGHSVEMWMWGGTRSYSDAAAYLPFKVYDLEKGCYVEPEKVIRAEDTPTVSSETLPSPVPAPSEGANAHRQAEQVIPPQLRKKWRYPGKTPPAKPPAKPSAHMPAAAFATRTPPVVAFTEGGMGELYFAIYNTIGLSQWVTSWKASPESRVQILYRYLNGDDDVDGAMRRCLAAVGYEGDGASASWVNCLLALGALITTKGGFLAHGPTAAQPAARRLYAMALAAARAAAGANRVADEAVSMGTVHAQLVAPDLASGEAQALLTLLRGEGDTPVVDTRFLVWCARALGLLTFVEVAESPVLIRSPQLTPLAAQIIHPEPAVPVVAPQEGTSPADAPPTA